MMNEDTDDGGLTAWTVTEVSIALGRRERSKRGEANWNSMWLGRIMGMVYTVLNMGDKLRRTHPDLFIEWLTPDGPDGYKKVLELDTLTRLQETTQDRAGLAYLVSLPGWVPGQGGQLDERAVENHGFLVMAVWANQETNRLLKKWLVEQLAMAKKVALAVNLPMAENERKDRTGPRHHL